MAGVLQGSSMELSWRIKDTGSFKTLTCSINEALDVSNDVNTIKTKCGVFKGIQVADFKLNGEATFNTSLGGSENSYDEVLAAQIDRSEIEWIYRNAAVTGYAAGELIRMSGNGYFTNTVYNGSEGEVARFTWNIEGTGTLNDTES
jgi:hypothetical protein